MRKQALLNIICIISVFIITFSCSPKPENVTNSPCELIIYPDYRDITIPVNIAPLNFIIRNENVDAIEVLIKGQKDSIKINSNGIKAIFPIEEWEEFLQKENTSKVQVTVIARIAGKWLRFKEISWNIVSDKIDSYISYRLIEPGYEVWSQIEIRERDLENFDERQLAVNSDTENSCMNCHIHGGTNGELSMFHLRGEKGGTILNKNGKLRKLSLKNKDMISGAVYGDFHPSGRYAVFSSNIIIPAFHSKGNMRMEVYDNGSDLSIADFDRNIMITTPMTSKKDFLETFPTFSADGKKVYFCSAPQTVIMDSISNLHYSLCSIEFNAVNGNWGNKIDTLWNARINKGSVCHPKASPDGKYLMFTIADYGTFPIWHRETDLKLLDLKSGKIDNMEVVNSDRSDTYHSWSSNSRWFAFASKRRDGQYGRIYLAYIDKAGKVHKPFVIPQSDPENDDMNLKSYNIPDLSNRKVSFSSKNIKRIYRDIKAEQFN